MQNQEENKTKENKNLAIRTHVSNISNKWMHFIPFKLLTVLSSKPQQDSDGHMPRSNLQKLFSSKLQIEQVAYK